LTGRFERPWRIGNTFDASHIPFGELTPREGKGALKTWGGLGGKVASGGTQ